MIFPGNAALIKRKENFPRMLENSEGSGAKSYIRKPFLTLQPILVYDFAADPI
jgi:hypothetical protein